jgi:hypothetical protein
MERVVSSQQRDVGKFQTERYLCGIAGNVKHVVIPAGAELARKMCEHIPLL